MEPTILKLAVKQYFMMTLAYLQDCEDLLNPDEPLVIVIPEPALPLIKLYFQAYWNKLPEGHFLRAFRLEITPFCKPSPNPVLFICHKYLSKLSLETCLPEGNLPASPIHNQYKRDKRPFLYPSGALECLAEWDEKTGGNMAVLIGDTGPATYHALYRATEQTLASYSTSALLNFHALGLWSHQMGGALLMEQAPQPEWSLALLVTAGNHLRYPASSTLINRELADFSCHDLQILVEETMRAWINPEAQTFTGILCIGELDPALVPALFPKMHNALNFSTDYCKAQLLMALEEVALNIFEQTPQRELILYYLGNLFYTGQQYNSARTCFERCLEKDGKNPLLYRFLSLCHMGLKDYTKAAYYQQLEAKL